MLPCAHACYLQLGNSLIVLANNSLLAGGCAPSPDADAAASECFAFWLTVFKSH